MRNLAILFVLLWSTAAGAVPSTINFTGRLTTLTGPVNGAVNITLRLFADAEGGNPLWSEAHTSVGADNGLVFLDVGTQTTLDENVLDGRRLFVEIAVGTETLAPRLALNSVPYAVRTQAAATADLLGGTVGAGDVVTSVTGNTGVSATKSGNGVTVGLSTAGCSNGQVYKFNGTTFACAADANNTYTGGGGISVSGTTISLSTTGCAAGSVWKFNGTAFACQPEANNAYTGGTGINVTGTTIALSTTGCANGSVWKFNGTTFACAPDANTTLTAAAPLNITSGTVSISGSGCTPGQVLQWNGSAFVCTSPFTASSCTWAVAVLFPPDERSSLDVVCPGTKHPISGGCSAANGGTVIASQPSGSPADGTAVTGESSWNCKFSVTAPGHAAYALCCNSI